MPCSTVLVQMDQSNLKTVMGRMHFDQDDGDLKHGCQILSKRKREFNSLMGSVIAQPSLSHAQFCS